MNATNQRYAILVTSMLSAAAWSQSPALDAQATTSHTFSPAQRAEIEARDQLARTIAANVEADALTRHDPQWRTRLMSALYSVSSSSLRNIAMQAQTVDQTHALAAAARTSQNAQTESHAKSLGDATDDLVFTQKTPCRFIDTRNVGGVIPKGSPTFTVFDTFQTGPTYGGDSGCTLPGNGEIAIAANITVTVASGAAGFLGIRPLGTTTRSSLVNWPTGGTTGFANAAIITTAQDSTSHHYEFEAYAGGNTPYLIVDYFGYFAPNAPTALDCVSTGMETVTVNSGGFEGFGLPACPSGYTIVAPLCEVTGGNGVLFIGTEQFPTNGNPVCAFYNTGASSQPAFIGSKCCRVP